MLVFDFLQGSAVNPSFWNCFSINYCSLAQQPRLRVFKPGFQDSDFYFPVSNQNCYFIFQVFKFPAENGHFWFTLIGPMSRNLTTSLVNTLHTLYFLKSWNEIVSIRIIQQSHDFLSSLFFSCQTIVFKWQPHWFEVVVITALFLTKKCTLVSCSRDPATNSETTNPEFSRNFQPI